MVLVLTSIFADELVGAIGLALPPYVLPETNNGIELDIVRETLAMSGHTIKPEYVPFKRVKHTLSSGKADFAMTITEASGIENVFYSDSHIAYQNVVITLADKNIPVNSVDDLANISISAFQDANIYLGPEYKAMSEKNSEYSEIAEQDRQIALLFSGRVQALVMDINIFKYFRNNSNLVDTSAKVTIHEIFPKSNYKVAFKNEAIRDQFNADLKKMIDSGKIEELFNKYIK